MAESYVQQQAAIAAGINVVVNPALAWVGNREMAFVPVDALVINVLITSLILSWLVAVFSALGARHELGAGHAIPAPGHPSERRVLSKMPARSWVFGLLSGAAAGLVMVAVFLLLSGLGFSGMSFWAYLVFLAVYTGVLAFAVARSMILRQAVQPMPVG